MSRSSVRAPAGAPPRFEPPDRFNIADYFLGDRLREGRGERRALLTADGALTYAEVDALAGRYAHALRDAGVRPEERVLIALPDGPEFVAALFATLRLGAVAVMLNPALSAGEIEYFFAYTRGHALFLHSESARPFLAVRERAAAGGDPHGIRAPRVVFVVDEPGFRAAIAAGSAGLEAFPSHPDDAAIWLFSGGTTGRPKAVIQTHRSFANTTESYAKRVIRYAEDDVTLSVPKLYFGYATGSNLFFPFAVGATAALFPERCSPETLYAKIEAFRPTILVNVPTMVAKMLAHPGGPVRDLSSLRLATSAGEALPPELHRRWDEAFGVPLLDGLGTAEMWHIFLSNHPHDVRPGTLGTVVPGFEVRVRDDEGRDLPPGETGWLWVRGDSRALGYWQRSAKTAAAFRGEWYVSGDMVTRDADGVFTYQGRGDDMLKVSGKWLSPKEVEDCLLAHPAVREVAVVGLEEEGLVKPAACVVLRSGEDGSPVSGAPGPANAALAEELQAFVRDRLAPYKYPRRVLFVEELPRTHLGKVDRGRVRELAAGAR
ncbi:MAG: benzoate-CoA ligase family protein [Gemmatimonadota bacterium]